MKFSDIFEPVTAAAGTISFIPLDGAINTYAMFVTLVCGTISLVKVVLKLIRLIQRYHAGKLTLDDTIEEIEKMEVKSDEIK